MRIVRLALGLIILIQGILMRDTIYGMMGAFLSFMAFANVGCCGTGGCGIPMKQGDARNTQKEIRYEEVDSK